VRKELIEWYHRHLTEESELTAELFRRMKNGMAARRLMYGERELGISLRPHFLTREQYELLARSSEVLAGALARMAGMVVERPGMLDRLGMSGRQRSLALVDPGYGAPTVNSRLDAFVFGNEVRYVEYNAENPSSLTDQTGLNQILFEVPAMQALLERYRLRQFSTLAALVDSLLVTYREWGGSGVPHVAILDWPDLPTGHEFILLRNHFAGLGIPTVICHPDEIEYSQGRLRRGDFRIDLVYKRIIIHEFLDRYDDDHPLIRAYRNRDVCLINPFRCKIMHKKAAFELLTDEETDGWLTPEEKTVISATVPWTRRVFGRKTVYRGRRIDLIEHLRRNRPDFIIKPNDDYGGHGIFLGNRMNAAEWDDALEQALRGDYVAQERIDLQTEPFPIFTDDDWTIEEMFVDTNPFLFRDRVDGVMVRLSDSPVVNVTSGGGETGFFMIEDRI